MLVKISNKNLIRASGALALSLLMSASPVALAANCKANTTAINQIQGAKAQSPLEGKKVSVQGVVSGVFPKLGGYFVQSDEAQWDDKSGTSEGIFIRDSKNKPNVGDSVLLAGKVSEIEEVTHLTEVSEFSVCGKGGSINAINVSLPLTDSLEQYEGMLVRFNQELTISENYGFARYGQLLLSNGRLFQPTNIARPGPKAAKIAAQNRNNQIILDDGSNAKNPKIKFSANHLYRVGNGVAGVEGVVHYSFGKYIIEPTVAPKFSPLNAREVEPVINQ